VPTLKYYCLQHEEFDVCDEGDNSGCKQLCKLQYNSTVLKKSQCLTDDQQEDANSETVAGLRRVKRTTDPIASATPKCDSKDDCESYAYTECRKFSKSEFENYVGDLGQSALIPLWDSTYKGVKYCLCQKGETAAIPERRKRSAATLPFFEPVFVTVGGVKKQACPCNYLDPTTLKTICVMASKPDEPHATCTSEAAMEIALGLVAAGRRKKRDVISAFRACTCEAPYVPVYAANGELDRCDDPTTTTGGTTTGAAGTTVQPPATTTPACNANTCKNGTCKNEKCKCKDGWTGAKCDTKIKDCCCQVLT